MLSRLFEPLQLGPISLRNRTIRAAAFEGMTPDHLPSGALIDYHSAVARGGVGMTTVAYAAVARSGLAFAHQLWMHEQAVTGLRALTDAVHRHGACASIQLGHCGNMAKRRIAGQRALAPSAKFNLYGPNWPRAISQAQIAEVVGQFADAVKLARRAGFDAVEVHAGHGYLISQFLSPWTNRRDDDYGGSLENRARFLCEVIEAVRHAAGNELALLVKINLRDGFAGGNELDDAIVIARLLEQLGVDALVLSGGFVSRAPMYIMRGSMPIDEMARRIPSAMLRGFVRAFGGRLVKEVPYSDHYFLEDAVALRRAVKLPLVYVGGVASRRSAEAVLAQGFDAIAMARALIRDSDFVNKLAASSGSDKSCDSGCDHCNICAARIYTTHIACPYWPNNAELADARP